VLCCTVTVMYFVTVCEFLFAFESVAVSNVVFMEGTVNQFYHVYCCIV